ncbi:MAG: imidazole glycerol phosphate synthase subunit HisF [Hydrococcus sp. RU_2_2]|nr:imidazole glycerol phosphate synthase subunit HisF [Hydrococcus sp. RU_2_2]
MLKRRLIPKLQMKSSQFGSSSKMVLVTTREYQKTIEIGNPVSQAKIYEAQAADELIFLDIDAPAHQRNITLDVIKRAAEEIFMPITIGGGIRSIEDFRLLLSHGADKVSINTIAIENPDLIGQASSIFGAQCVVVSIDYKKESDGTYRVWGQSGKLYSNWDVINWAIEVERRGAGEILLTSIDRDGMRQGLDINITKQVVQSVSIPVITSGGCGLAAHFVEGFIDGQASAVAAGTYFSFKDENIMQTRAQIKNAGVPIRIHT